MRISPQRHTLAVLRLTIGLTQKEMAALVGCSRPTIQEIELGKGLKLSESLAEKIRQATGIGLKWLLSGDPSQPAVADNGEPYTKETFERWRARLKFPSYYLPPVLVIDNELEWFNAVLAMTLTALRADKFQLFAYKLTVALRKLLEDFPVAKDFHAIASLNQTQFRKGEQFRKGKQRCALTALGISYMHFEKLLSEFATENPPPHKKKAPKQPASAK